MISVKAWRSYRVWVFRLFAALLICGPCSIPLVASAQAPDSVEVRINAANALLENQEIDAAIKAYSSIVPERGEQRDELNYNLGVAHYRDGDLPAARALFAESARSSQTKIAANSRYNLGNCDYSDALASAEQERPEALEKLSSAIANYRSSLRLNRNNADARANVELAGRLIRKLKEQEKQEQESQEQESQEQESQEQESQEQESQEQESQEQESQEQEGQEQEGQEQEGQEQEGQEQEGQEQEGHEQEGQEQEGQESEGQESEGQDSQGQEGQKQEGQKQEASQGNESEGEQTESQQPGADSKTEGEPSDSSTGELTSENASKESPDSLAEEKLDPNAKRLMTKQEALKMLQAVRDRDMIRRLNQQRRERSRRIPVDRDW